MKELSIEEKARRYDEVIKVAKRNYDTIIQMDEDCTFAKEGIVNTFNHIFPELQEDDDEKIRKDIIAYMRYERKSTEEEIKNRFIPWLEKQGEQTTDKIIERARTEKQRVLLTETNGDAYIDWDCRSLQDVKSLLKYGLEYIDAQLEKQGEQKPTDKVESKFKVGDWVVYCNEDVDLITGIEEKGYRINEGGYIPFACEDDMRLWTIQDAKDGDVLADDYSIIIFRKIGNESWSDVVNYYVGWNYKNKSGIKIQSGKSHYGKIDNVDFKPATKEQRDLLFTKMKEDGYEWDVEDKVLRKIERKKPTWSEEDEERYMSCLLKLGTGNLKQPETINTVWLRSLKERVQLV